MSKLFKAWHNEQTGEYFTPKVRLIYTQALLEPKINRKFPTNPAKFSVSALVPKAADVSVIVQAVSALAAGLWGPNWKEMEVKLPIKKTGNYEKLAEYAAEYPWMIRASANAEYPPVLFGPDTKPARREASEVYSGRWGVLALNVWGPKPENKNVNRFVSLGLQRVQFLDHD